jgi:uncharacterized protein (TIGR02001 family)
MKKISTALLLTGLASAPGLALAAEESPHKLSGTLTLASDYIFRGISQTGGDMAIQGGLEYTHSSGFYLGTWGSNVGWIEDFQLYQSGNIEVDLYGGYRGAIGDTGLTFDVGAIQYFYPGDKPSGVTDADTTEIYAGLGWKWFTVKYSYYVSDEVFGFAKADGSDYLDISASYPVGDTGLTLGAHWGTFSFDNNKDQDYDDWKVSVTYDMGKLSNTLSGVTFGIAYTDTDAKKTKWTDANNEYLGDSTTTVWLTKSF